MKNNSQEGEVHWRCTRVLRVDRYLGVGTCIRCLGNTWVVNNNIVVIDVDRARGHFVIINKATLCPKICVHFV